MRGLHQAPYATQLLHCRSVVRVLVRPISMDVPLSGHDLARQRLQVALDGSTTYVRCCVHAASTQHQPVRTWHPPNTHTCVHMHATSSISLAPQESLVQPPWDGQCDRTAKADVMNYQWRRHSQFVCAYCDLVFIKCKSHHSPARFMLIVGLHVIACSMFIVIGMLFDLMAPMYFVLVPETL